MNHSSGESDPRPTAALPILRIRAEMLEWTRKFFGQHGYWEVETPLLSHDVCVDAWLEPFRVEVGTDGRTQNMYLQTSPEFGMKRLLAAGADAIFQVTRAFRQEECGPLHNPEFTIVEWYRVGDTYHQQMDLVEQFVLGFHQHASQTGLSIERLTASEQMGQCFNTPFNRMTYEEAFRQATGQSVLAMSAPELQSIARSCDIHGPASLEDDDRDGWLNLILSERVEPMLAAQGAVFLYDYPASQAALSRISDHNPAVAERFELYIRGIEICNGYQELTDARELKDRQSEQAERRRQARLPALPEDNRLIQTLEQGLPECAGVALGFDRILMSAFRMTSLRDVMAFPLERA